MAYHHPLRESQWFSPRSQHSRSSGLAGGPKRKKEIHFVDRKIKPRKEGQQLVGN